ncbi:MAG: sigma-70 family RNA polymerase sigma factor [Oscillospiraceae bacterium]|nr:sigma-70 family RNA polymerase sigma factor [Oscillospiraceae bacterium]
MTEDEKLIFNIRRKRRGAFEKLIEKYTAYVSTVVYNVCGSSATKEDIEEIVSDTFVSLWLNAENFNSHKGNLRTYLGTIARNLATDMLRTIHTTNTELDENIASAQTELYAQIEQNEERETMIRLIRELGEPDSEIFIRYYYYDEKISYISSNMNLNINTVKTKLARGRRHLKDIWERRNGNE